MVAEPTLDQMLSEDFLQTLRMLAETNAKSYKAAQPFAHAVFDDFLPEAAAEAALAGYPQPRDLTWTSFDNALEKKLSFDTVERLPAGDRDVLLFLNSRPMLKFLETLTGIEGLIPDPYFEGGGLHQIQPGGKLAVHADFNVHPWLKLDRRINVILYLNKDWREEYNGHLELWDQQLTRAEKKILPVFNRCAIFSTTSWSFHGHPEPLTCPPGRTRKSIATYYYTSGRPREEREEVHSTLFAPLHARKDASPVEDAQQVPELANASAREKLTLRRLAWLMCPPAVHELYKKAVGRTD